MGELPGLLLAAVLSLATSVADATESGPTAGLRAWTPLTPKAEAVRAEIRDRGPVTAGALLARWPDPGAYRCLLFRGDRTAMRAAARCLVRLRDRPTVEKILRLAESRGFAAGDYPAALFGWVVGASYDARLLPRIRGLLASQDTRTRIFALEAARTLTFLRARMPETEPRFANPGEVWFMRRWCYRNSAPTTDRWLTRRVNAMASAMADPAEAREARRFFARFRRK